MQQLLLPGVILILIFLYFVSGRKSQDSPMTQKPPILFTEEEKEELRRDEAMLAVTRAVNERNGATQQSFEALMAQMGAVAIPDVVAAVQTRSMARLKQAITKGADVDEPDLYGNRPIFLAAEQGNLEALKLLVEQGANLLVRNEENQSVLDVAATEEVKKYLLSVNQKF